MWDKIIDVRGVLWEPADLGGKDDDAEGKLKQFGEDNRNLSVSLCVVGVCCVSSCRPCVCSTTLRTKGVSHSPPGDLPLREVCGCLHCFALRRSGCWPPSPSAQSTPGRTAWPAASSHPSLRDTRPTHTQ